MQVAEGRRREFERFAAFAGEEVPDPQDPATFRASKLDPGDADLGLRTLYAELLALRAELPRAIDVRVDGQVLTMRRGPIEVVVDFESRAVEIGRA